MKISESRRKRIFEIIQIGNKEDAPSRAFDYFIVTVILWFRSAKNDKTFKRMWLAVTLSFLFYIPVVLFSQTMPMIGMLMLPKTCMYIWMIAMFLKEKNPVSSEK